MSKMYIFYDRIRVCCGCDVIVIYDVIDQMETIRSINANSFESYVVMHNGHHAQRYDLKFQNR